MLNSVLTISAFAARQVTPTRVTSSTSLAFYSRAKCISLNRRCNIASSVNRLPIASRPFSSSSSRSEKGKGTVKWFDPKKGFGFISPIDGSADVFVHHSNIYARGLRSLMEGEDVEFEVVNEAGRTFATNVTGPFGAYVKGRPRRRDEVYDRNRENGGSENRSGGYIQEHFNHSEDGGDSFDNIKGNNGNRRDDSGDNHQK